LSSELHHIAARRGGKLKRSSTSLAGVDGLVAGEDEEEQGREGRENRGCNGRAGSNGHGMDRSEMAPGAVLYELDKLWVPLCEVNMRWVPHLDDT
jgi:hypothetical protein